MPIARGPDRRLFDLWSLFSDLPFVQRLTYRPIHEEVLRLLRATAPHRVLDVGCGTGLLTARSYSELRKVRVVGCDFSAGMLRDTAAHTRAVLWTRGDAQRLPLRDASFDAIVSTEAQRRIYRMPAGLALPPVLTTASKEAG